MLPLGWRLPVVAIVVLIVLGSVVPGVAIASAGGAHTTDTTAPSTDPFSQRAVGASDSAAEGARTAWERSEALGPGEAFAAVEPISGCTVVDAPGRYELNRSFQIPWRLGICIDVQSDDVILDGQGHSIRQVPMRDQTAIDVEGFTNVTVTNVTFAGDPGRGIYRGRSIRVRESTDVTVTDVDVGWWRTGIYVRNATGVTLRDVEAEGNVDTIVVSRSAATIERSRVRSYSETGLEIEDAAGPVSVVDTQMIGGDVGISVSGPSTVTFDRVTATRATTTGIVLGEESTGTFTDTVVENNGDSDLSLAGSATATNLSVGSATLSFESRNVAVSGVDTPPRDPSGYKNVGGYFEARNQGGGFLDVDVSYAGSDLSDVDESTLALFEYDGSTWTEVSGSSHNEATNTVSANLTSLSVFAPLGEFTGPAPPPDLVVDDDGLQCPVASHTTIQSAVDAAKPGDTIEVCAGMYDETVTVDEDVTLVANGTAILDARDASGTAFEVVADGVTIDGFEIRDYTGEVIQVEGVSNVTVTNNTIRSGSVGISFEEDANDGLVQGNTLFSRIQADGLASGMYNLTVRDNEIIRSRGPGINLDVVHDSVVVGNTVVGGGTGIWIQSSDGTEIRDNEIELGSGIGGEAILSGFNSGLLVANNTVTGGGGGSIGVYITRSEDVTVAENRITDVSVGVTVWSRSSGTTIRDTRISIADVGIELFHSATGTTIRDTRIATVDIGISAGSARVLDTVVANASTAVRGGSVTATNLTLDTAVVSFDARSVSVAAEPSPPADPSNLRNISWYVDVTPTGSSASMDLTVGYTDAAVAASEVNESTLGLFESDGSTWAEVSDSSRDPDENTVSGTLTTFGVVAPLGSPTGLTIDPIADQTVTEGESAEVPVTVFGVDSADPPTLSLGQHPDFVSLSDHGDGTGTVTLAPQSGDAGTYTVEVIATNSTVTATETFAVATSKSGVVFAVNAGGPEYTANDGTVYAADTGFDRGFAFGSGSFGTLPNPEISDTIDDRLYRSERYGTSFEYDVPVSNGTYEVTLQFAEIYQGVSASDEPDSSGPTDGTDENDRVFDVSAEGEQVVSEYDILAEVGPLTATEETYTVEVTDGVLNLEFTAINDHAKVSAITVSVPDGGTGALTIDPIADQTVTEGGSVGVPVTVSGVDGADPPTLSLGQHPGFVSLSDDGDGTGTMTLSPQRGDVGTYTVEVIATNGTATATETFTVTVADNESGVVFAVNAGDSEYTASDGTVYAADTGFDRGFAFGSGSFGTPSDPEISDTDDDALYRSERYGTSFSYDVPVSNGTYEVTLQFAEIYQGVSATDEPDSSGPTDGTDENDRVFDVSAEGDQVVSEYDIFAEVGSLTATEVTYTVEVTDGVLNLEFTAINDHAKVSAITVSVSDTDSTLRR